MKKISIVLIIALLSLCIFTGCSNKDKDSGTVPSDSPAGQTTEAAGDHETMLDLKSFRNIDVEINAGDISVVPGEDYTIHYQLHGKETISDLRVEDDTLKMETSFDGEWTPDECRKFVTITVPKGTKLGEISMKTGSGNIDFTGYDYTDGKFDSGSGNVNLSEAECKTVSVNAGAGIISLTGYKADDADLETVTGNINVSQCTLVTLECNTVSDDISVSSCNISKDADLESNSGNITSIGTQFKSVDAESNGEITYNGKTYKNEYKLDKGDPEIDANSVTGNIVIDTK